MPNVTGDIIDIEQTSDGGTSWTVVGKSRGTVSWSPNTNVAESGDHSDLQQNKSATSEAWEIAIEGLIQSTLGGLDTLGIYDSTSGELAGSVGRGSGDGYELRITVWEDEAAKSAGAGNENLQLSTTDFLAVLDDFNVEEDDFSTYSLTVHSRERPTVDATA